MKKKVLNEHKIAWISLKIDAKLKDDTCKILKKLGLSQTAAIRLYFEYIVEHKSLPFEYKNLMEQYKLEEKRSKLIANRISKIARLKNVKLEDILADLMK